MKPAAKKVLRGLAIAVGVVVLAGGGYYLLRYQAWAAYRNWSIGRMNGLARDFLAADDSRNALLTVRKVLRQRPNDIEAWRIGAESARRRDTAEAVHFQKNLTRVQPTAANQVELIRLALKYRVYSVALDVIPNVNAEARALPEYHRLAAETYGRVERAPAAITHWQSLLALKPDDAPAQLALAELEFEAAPELPPAGWTERVQRLVAQPDTALAATLLQLRRAVAGRDLRTAAPLAAQLQARVDLDLTQKLHVLDALYLTDAPAAELYLAELQRQAVAQPADVVRVMGWLARQKRAPDITQWYARLPEAAQGEEQIKYLTGRALDAQAEWGPLEQLMKGPAWKGGEAARQALLTRTYRMTGRPAEAAESWKLALIATGQQAREAVRLLQLVSEWSWEEERHDVLWKLFNLLPGGRVVREELTTQEFRAGNTVNLNKIFARIVQAEPDNDEARNNFAYTSLLLDTNLGRAAGIATDLHRRHPRNAAYLTTYTLALYKQGQAAQAFALLEEADATTRLAPSTRLHEAIYAPAAGRPGRTGELLPQLVRARMLPEERQLLTAARDTSDREVARTGRQQALAAAAATTADAGPVTGGWLAWLPETARVAGDEQRLADSLYRAKNFPALLELLRSASWPGQDHLRQALTAYGEQQQGQASGTRDTWSQAVATAGRDARRLRDLETLAGNWNWTAERMAVASRRFEREPANAALLAELIEYYRPTARASELARLLWLYVNATQTTGPEAAKCVYYSLLSDMNVAAAQTLAQKVYEAASREPRNRLIYAFALWRQKRAPEAWTLLQDIDPASTNGMQLSLIKTAVLLDLGRKSDAQLSFDLFTLTNAMPEEVNFAETLSRRGGLEKVTGGSATSRDSDVIVAQP